MVRRSSIKVFQLCGLTEGGEGDGVQGDEPPQRWRAFGQVNSENTRDFSTVHWETDSEDTET